MAAAVRAKRSRRRLTQEQLTARLGDLAEHVSLSVLVCTTCAGRVWRAIPGLRNSGRPMALRLILNEAGSQGHGFPRSPDRSAVGERLDP
jgi:hypothetical protein